MDNFARIILIVIVISVVAGGFFYYTRQEDNGYEFVTAQRGNLVQNVTVTGRVKPRESVDLAFEINGKIDSVHVNVGDTVNAHDPLMGINNAELLAELQEAEAAIRTEESTLRDLLRGNLEEDIQVKQAERAEALQVLRGYHESITKRLEDAYAKSDDAVRIKTVSLISGSKASVYELTFDPCASQVERDAEFLRFQSEIELERWRTELNTLSKSSPPETLERTLINADRALGTFKQFLEKMNEALTTHCALANSTLDSGRVNISTARANVVTALNDIDSLEQQIASQKLTIERIERELDLKLAGTPEEQVQAQEARIAQARARAENIRAKLSKTTLRSPLQGIVTMQKGEVGEIVTARTTVVSLISEGQFEIEARVPEADIAKLSIGNEATLTLDAYGNDVVFRAQIIKIDPAETIIEGIPTYTTTLAFMENDSRVRSGMTADISIITAEKENVLAVPARAVVRRNDTNTVRIIDGGAVREVEVTVGLRSSDGRVEITQGIKEGDKVVTFFERQ